MTDERARVRRLARIEAIRDAAKRAAAIEAGRAEAARAHLADLADRTRRLAEDYAVGPGGGAGDGAAMLHAWRFAGGLRHIHESATRDVRTAGELADRRLAELALAERRRAAAGERAEAAARRLATRRETPALGARRAAGTELE